MDPAEVGSGLQNLIINKVLSHRPYEGSQSLRILILILKPVPSTSRQSHRPRGSPIDLAADQSQSGQYQSQSGQYQSQSGQY